MRHLRNLLAFGAALVVGGTLIGATAAQAQAGYYVAVPVQQPTKATLITRETLWTLRSNAYVASRAPDRDALTCDALARSTGALSAFSVAGKAFDADELAKCNAHAKGGAAGPAVARAR